jgi:hypothetical protein
VAEKTEAASQVLSTQLTLDKIDSDILRTARRTGIKKLITESISTGSIYWSANYSIGTCIPAPPKMIFFSPHTMRQWFLPMHPFRLFFILIKFLCANTFHFTLSFDHLSVIFPVRLLYSLLKISFPQMTLADITGPPPKGCTLYILFFNIWVHPWISGNHFYLK